MPHRSALIKKIATESTRLLLFGLAAGLGQMISHESGSNLFCLRWDPMKMSWSVVGSFTAAVIVGLIRYRMWQPSHPEAFK